MESDSELRRQPPTVKYRKTAGSLILELFMIGVGVFLGWSAESWRDARLQRELPRASLQNFRREIAANRSRIVAGRDYHAGLGKRTAAFIDRPGSHALPVFMRDMQFEGMRTVDFDQTA